MDIVLSVLFYVLYLTAAVFACLRWVHNLQLNSYQNKTQLRRFRSAPEKLFCLLPLLPAWVFSFLPFVWAKIVTLVFLAFSCLSLKPVKAKKPLVFTARVKRLLAVTAVLLLLFAGGGWFVPALSVGALFLSPLVILLANLLCAPMEKAVRNWYIGDAKRILNSCPELLILGVTGSYGKTSVKSYLGALLNAGFDTLITPESFNTPMGVVRTVRENLRSTHEIFVCEMGARHVGDIKELCDLVHPKHGIITAVGNQHLESFRTHENIRKTKYELADALPESGKLFVNWDCEAIRENPPARPYITYGLSEGCDYRAVDMELTLSGTAFTVEFPDGTTQRYRMPLIGEHSVLNVTGAIGVCHSFGIHPSALVPALRKLKSVPHRMELRPGPITYIDDAYNSNPAGCKAALDTLARFDACRILVTPGMVELGSAWEEENKAFGRHAAGVCDLCVLVGIREAEPIKAGLLEAGFPEERIAVVSSLQEGLARVNSFYSEKKKVVLLENDLPDNY
ncbi:MAG: UDP-N-acetylmuramoyl-tripeptide--D-alanyl-D-alanine ligase [Clostridia bacterium]|nr:UDP-N-acetylmuramoyl-tripeptide--D-alanyl-D-alanine ligase [Clostridia bacterium]